VIECTYFTNRKMHHNFYATDTLKNLVPPISGHQKIGPTKIVPPISGHQKIGPTKIVPPISGDQKNGPAKIGGTRHAERLTFSNL
jgi:hypothetical protein